MPHLMLGIHSRRQIMNLFLWETAAIGLRSPKIILLFNFMDLSCKVSVSEILVLVQDFPMFQVWEFIP